ncbi:hypothetical protein GCM10017581_038450 [Dactylosporangium matsuzakiense]|uniref:Recombinase domain-containing protein n=2 Tax=Dactylosporangium matsuzakiense TaxID=53360 RepID=A0A9W6KJ18_9ACTN|nr:hypothetical protein GCM10017581_038450 [Dactylosporangium matsuzakiense]
MAGVLAYRPDRSRAKLIFQTKPGSYNTDSLIEFLKQLRRHLRGKPVILIWDGLSAHRSKDMKAWLASQQHWLTVEQLPGYAHDLNPMDWSGATSRTPNWPTSAPTSSTTPTPPPTPACTASAATTNSASTSSTTPAYDYDHHSNPERSLTSWLEQARPAGQARRRRPGDEDGLRFAFYGRVSTADFQERASSRRWQRDAAEDLVAGHGVIVAEFFDIDRSRRLPWRDRPQAATLLQSLADPDRKFDAVVVGEYERAFFGDQALTVLPLLDAAGVRLWLPESHGPVDLNEPSHQALVMLLGAQSKPEVLRARFRALTAMRAQARDEGRFLGGRPLFGYRLVDAGPHPNPMHAKWGRRLQRYDPDPVTAPTVRWIFAQRLLGSSVSSIAAELNRTAVPCPSQADPGRNRHRAGSGWMLTTVQAILGNAKYTGRQVWNRQPAHHTPPHLPGPSRIQRWTGTDDWVVSTKVVHPALVTDADFVAVQRLTAAAVDDGPVHRYELVGLLRCGRCGRVLDPCWSHGRAAYRCRHGYTSARAQRERPRNLYVREDRMLGIVRDLFAAADVATRTAALVEHLRREHVMVICAETGCSLQPQ